MRKRSKYRPKPVMSDPLGLMQPASAADRTRLLLIFHTALDAMSMGRDPSIEEWRVLCDMVNTVEVIALEMGKIADFKGQVMPDIEQSIASMCAAAERYKKTKRMGLDGPGVQALRNVVGIYEQCIEGLTAREMAMATHLTQMRVRDVLSGRKQGNVIAL